MSNLIPLDDATEQFGVSKERLNELRESGKVRAYRDGSSWKFRADDLTAALASSESAESGLDLGDVPAAPAESSDLSLDLPEEPSDPSDSILVSESEADPSTQPPSTVIGKAGAPGSDLELSLEPDEGDDVVLGHPESDVKLAEASDVHSSPSGSHVLGDPSVTPPSGSFEDLEELEIDLEAESSKILSDIELAPPSGSGSGLELELTGDSAAGSASVTEDSELVLEDSGNSDITSSTSESGINLISPSDSGLELDEIPLDLVGSAVSGLDLGQEEELILDEEPGGEGMQTEDDFLLTPLGAGEEGEDSSSQVIQLDSAVDFAEEVEEAAVLTPVDDAPAVIETSITGVEATPGMAAAGVATIPDATFSGANIALLILCMIVLALCGIMVLDLMRNMWAWNDSMSLSSTLMEMLNFWN